MLSMLHLKCTEVGRAARIFSLALSLTVLFFSTSAPAVAEGDRTGFQFGGEGLEDVLFFHGPIVGGQTTIQFRRAIRQGNIRLLVLSSPGGDLDEGIIFAETVRDQGISTAVLEGDICASSCALVFFAGQQRFLEGMIGVHQFRSVTGEVSEIVTQWTVAELVQVLSNFEVPIIVLERMLQTPPDQMFWFGADSAALFSRSGGSAAVPLLRRELPLVADRVETIRNIQAELNRLGCSLGRADGVIGPRSRAALEEYSRRVDIAFDVRNFENPAFLRVLQETPTRICPTPPQPPQIDLSGIWDVNSACSIGGSPQRATMTVTRNDRTKFNFTTQSSLGSAQGMIEYSNGGLTGVLIEQANGIEVRSEYVVTLSNNGSAMTGRTSRIFMNGERVGGGVTCSFSATRG
jgi:peptidoglycan hydrolase-like protein with peptidoglycan-binding domain